MLHAEEYVHGRRRSVDVGGLALALENQGLGHGWGGWEEREQGGTGYAELLSDMYNHTQITVNLYDSDLSPIAIPTDTRCRLIKSLDRWHFEPHKLPDEEVLFCALILFESLFRIDGMMEEIGVSLDTMSIFLRHLRSLYCEQNTYHNFQHALDVLQASQSFLCAAGLVPPVSILLEDDRRKWRRDKSGHQNHLLPDLENSHLFALYIAGIGHDVAHPGLTNIFMKNSQAPLSAVYDNKSALERMHYAVLARAMQLHGLGHLLDRPVSGPYFRGLLAGIVLATDMSVHADFMTNFGLLADGGDYSKNRRILLFCQAIIKCADISNPSRPPGVSQYWTSALLSEWSSQTSLEKQFDLPTSLPPSECPLARVKGQIFFISTFAKPLMDIVAKAIPEMTPFAEQCRENLNMWITRSTELTPCGPLHDSCSTDHPILSLRPPEGFLTAFPLALPTFILSSLDEQSASVDWKSTYAASEHSSSSSDVSSESHPLDTRIIASDSISSLAFPSPPVSPSASVQSFVLAPRSQRSASSLRYTSTSSANEAAVAMRAAYQASVRKKKSFHHRYSWNASGSSSPSSSSACLSSVPKAALAAGVIVAEAALVDGRTDPYISSLANTSVTDSASELASIIHPTPEPI
ncbi:HD-domain/PDEase-like protein [Leucogyrophana mollusca]|uniref:HD-domain/PDEase-like protein n=1 Tax=Leucogyrophana mollusca TaxID=85980 RepID=A0ACB8BJ35_9AGAM|nr:HD-domain/PDEase-like protein [Leucogyrophana mollusca]